MEDFVKDGFAEIIPPKDADTPVDGALWYLPIHIIEKRGKTRPCHDVKAAVNGVSLNGQLLGGPNLIKSLHHIFLNFRKKSKDISKI